MAIDAQGNEIPVNPGYKRIVGNDGTPVAQEETIFLGPNISATAVDGGTLLEASGTPASSVTLGDMANLAANSVIGNNTGSAATPVALSATSFGLAALAAASQAALTALIAVATQALAGLMSAADKVKSDSWEPIHSAAFASVSSVSTASWTAGRYRRVKISLKMSTGTSTSVIVSFAGLDAGSYYVTGLTMGFVADITQSAKDGYWITTAAGLSSLNMDAQLATDGGVRSATGIAAQITGQGDVFSGVSIDSTHNVTGLTLTFSTASSGYLDVIGYL